MTLVVVIPKKRWAIFFQFDSADFIDYTLPPPKKKGTIRLFNLNFFKLGSNFFLVSVVKFHRPFLKFISKFTNEQARKNLDRLPNPTCPQPVHNEAYFTVPSAQDI